MMLLATSKVGGALEHDASRHDSERAYRSLVLCSKAREHWPTFN